MKAGLSEIFTAMNGIVCAGVTPTREGHDTREHPLADLAVRAAMLNFDVRATLMARPSQGEETAQTLIRFLSESRLVLSRYPDVALSEPKGEKPGGAVRDLRCHIADILSRERGEGTRPADKINRLTGFPEKPFKADYMPAAAPKREKEVSMPDFKTRKRGAAADFQSQFALT